MVQTGTQSRSSHAIAEAISGSGKGTWASSAVRAAFVTSAGPASARPADPSPFLPSVNYGLWCGPAPIGPLLRKHLHYDWHWVWPTGNGDLGNQGIHQMDLARWVLGETALSPRILERRRTARP